MESAAIARDFVDAMNAFDVAVVGGLLTEDFEFTIGTHTANRDDFLVSLATGPETDPKFTFQIDWIDGTDVHGRQEYYWRETGELATSAARVLRLELADEMIRRAVVDDAA